jgi:hypothetical protein
MNSKRKADLQRKLSMVSVPKPPAGLADRIKQDIPQYLGTQNERERFSKAIAFNLRVAASVIVLVSSAYLCLRLFSHESFEVARSPKPVAAIAQRMDEKRSEVLSNAAPPPLRQPVIAPNAPPAAPQPMANVAPPPSAAERIVMHRQVDEVTSAPVAAAATPTAVAAAEPAPVAAPKAEETLADATRRKKETKDTLETGVAGGTAPASAPPAAMNEAANFVPQAQSAINGVAKTFTTSINSDLVRSANAGTLDFDARNSVFGISVNNNAFEQVKSAIEHGERPSNVDVEGLVNYFAGAAKRSPREVSLEAEGSPAPIDEGPRTVFVRYTVDTARGDLPPHASVPPIATDARVDIEFDSRAVASFRRVGGDARADAVEPSLLKNVSVTAVYAVQLQPQVTEWMNVATVRLHYKNVTNGRQKTQTRLLNVRDVTQPWSRASRRHRLASLGAVWGEQLKSSTGGADLARRAEELSKQEPRDERAKELATLANASSR